MSAFATHIQLEPLWNPAGTLPLNNRDGRRLFETDGNLHYDSDIAGAIEIASGFITDLGSVPRIPIVYDLLGDIAIEPYVIHDYLYSKGLLTRLMADQVLREALLLVGISRWKAELIYAGVRIGGASHYGPGYAF